MFRSFSFMRIFRKDCRKTIKHFGFPFFVLSLLSLPLLVFFPWQIWVTVWTAFEWWQGVLLALLVADLITWFCCFLRFLYPFWCIHKVNEHDAEVSGASVITYDGGPRVGKTYSMTYDGVLLADTSYYENKVDDLINAAKLENGEQFRNWEECARAKILRDSILHEENKGGMEMLYSNYPVWRDGVFCSRLFFSHFMQRSRLPEGFVGLEDESADLFSNKRIHAKQNSKEDRENTLINETTSKIGHFYDGKLRFAEQDNNENYIGLRRVCAFNRYIYQRDELCRPNRLIRRYEKLRAKVFKKGYCDPKRYRKIKRLKKRIDGVGFFRFWYKDTGNTERDAGKLREGFYILPLDLSFHYATRAYLFQNAALDKKFSGKIWDSLYLRTEDIDKKY